MERGRKCRGVRLFLVYQCGIANVFKVACFNLAAYGRDALRLYQGDYRGAMMFAQGAGAVGACIRTAHCEEAGDIAGAHWTDGKGDMWEDKRADLAIN